MNYLSNCLIIRDEHLYLAEYLSFYLKHGHEHFYIYDNSEDDSGVERHKKAASEFEKYITWHRVKGLAQQRVAYNHCIDNYKNATSWVSFTDCDEFLFSKASARFVDTLKKEYDSRGINGLAIHWLIFGSSGELEYRDEPVTKRFTKRAARTNPHVKSVMRLSKTLAMRNNPHTFAISDGYIVNEQMDVMPKEYAIMHPPTSRALVIHHYVTKSKAEFWKRRSLPKADSGLLVDIEENFKAHDLNEVNDPTIHYFT